MTTIINNIKNTFNYTILRFKTQLFLPLSVKIYVPSTININKEFDNSKLLDETLYVLTGMFGGCTMSEGIGTWESEKGIVKEKVNICESFTDKGTLKSNLNDIINHCEYLKRIMKQEGISLEIGGKFYVI